MGEKPGTIFRNRFLFLPFLEMPVCFAMVLLVIYHELCVMMIL